MEEVEDHFITDYFLASSWQLYTLKRNKLQYTDSWSFMYWSLFQKAHWFGDFFGTNPTLWGYIGPYFNFYGTFTRELILWVVAWKKPPKNLETKSNTNAHFSKIKLAK